MRNERSWHHGHLMRARSSPCQLCGGRLLKAASRLRSTTSWMHFARWTSGLRKPATATVASCEDGGFSAAAAARAVTDNLFIRGGLRHVAFPIHHYGDRFPLPLCGGSHDGRRGLMG